MDKIISVYWFAVLLIVAGAVVYMVSSFYGNPYDIRDYETQTLISHVAECVIPNNYLDKKFVSEYESENFLSDCRINFATESDFGWDATGQYFFNLKIQDFNSGESFFDNSFGNLNINDLCTLQKNEITGEKLPFCLERKFYSVDSDGTQYLVIINAAIDKNEKNVN